MKHISLGGLEISRIGLGTMAMSGYYLDPSSSDAESIRTIQRALELGVTHIDTAEIYGPYANEELVGRALKGRRDDVVVATKFGFVSHSGGGPGVLDSSPANIRTAVEGSLKRLGTDRIDLYYQHRVDPNTPIEDTVGVLAELVAEGKVLHIGLSEAGPETIRRAQAVHPIAALQTEYSLWTRDPEGELLPLLRELGVGFVPYSPLGHGFLTGTIRSPEELADDDWRKTNPRFTEGNFEKNLRIVDEVQAVASEIDATTAQVASGLATRAGRRHRPDPRHKARLPRRREHSSRRHRAERRADSTAQRSHPGHRRAPRRDEHGRSRPLTTVRGGVAVSIRATLLPRNTAAALDEKRQSRVAWTASPGETGANAEPCRAELAVWRRWQSGDQQQAAPTYPLRLRAVRSAPSWLRLDQDLDRLGDQPTKRHVRIVPCPPSTAALIRARPASNRHRGAVPDAVGHDLARVELPPRCLDPRARGGQARRAPARLPPFLGDAPAGRWCRRRRPRPDGRARRRHDARHLHPPALPVARGRARADRLSWALRSLWHRRRIERGFSSRERRMVGFPSQRSRVRGPSSALGDRMRVPAKPWQQSGIGAVGGRSSTVATCDVRHLRRTSWPHLGPPASGAEAFTRRMNEAAGVDARLP